MSKQHSILLPKTATTSNEFIVKFRAFNKVKCCFDAAAIFGNNVKQVFHEISSYWQSGNKLNCLICFDFVEGRSFVQQCCQKRQHCCQKCQSNIRLWRKNRSTYSIRQCCWCGRGFRLPHDKGIGEHDDWPLTSVCVVITNVPAELLMDSVSTAY